MKNPWSVLVEVFARGLGVAADDPRSPRVRPIDGRDGPRGRAGEVRKLAALGLPRAEIARRTGLSQDAIGMMLHLSDAEAADSAGSGTFFRILETRMAS